MAAESDERRAASPIAACHGPTQVEPPLATSWAAAEGLPTSTPTTTRPATVEATLPKKQFRLRAFTSHRLTTPPARTFTKCLMSPSL